MINNDGMIKDLVLKYIPEESHHNLYANRELGKIVGIECNPTIKNENHKEVGRVIFLNGVKKKLHLNMMVEFRIEKNKWYSISKQDENGNMMYLVNPYWVKPYEPVLKVEVPISVYDPKTDSILTILRKYTYESFVEYHLLEYFEKHPHRIVAAYYNFVKLYKNNKYWYAVNATVRNYRVHQDLLTKLISDVNIEKKRIKSKWMMYLQSGLKKDSTLKMLNKLFNDCENERKIDNVVRLRVKKRV